MEKEKKKRITGIRSKLICMILMFTAVLLVVIWLLFVVLLENIYKNTKENEIKNAAKTVIAIINSSPEEIREEINEISASSGASTAVLRLAPNGAEKYFISSAMPMSILSNKISVNGILKQVTEDGGEMTYILDTNAPPNLRKRPGIADQDMLYVKTVKAGEDTAVIMICIPLASVNTTRNTIVQLLIIVSAAFVILAVIVGRLLSDRLAIPLEKLNVSAKDVGTPKYKKIEGSPGCRETAELNETLGRASEELQKVDNLRRELIANVSHDLRTPLTLISGYGEMMRDIPGENTKENIQIIIDEAEHLNRLVTDVLSLSKLESGMEILDLKEFNVTSSLKALIDRYSALRAIEGYTLQFEYDREYTIVGDEVKIIQVMYNLINNAITYTGSSCRVLIRQSETEHGQKRFLRFDVIDDGDGILPENIPYVWDRYYKENRAHKRAGVGTGLGLSIVKNVMEKHGGYYGVESEVNKGSDFYVEFPFGLSPTAEQGADDVL